MLNPLEVFNVLDPLTARYSNAAVNTTSFYQSIPRDNASTYFIGARGNRGFREAKKVSLKLGSLTSSPISIAINLIAE